MGAGVEQMIDPHVMLSLEYLYYGFDNVALTGPISPGSFLPRYVHLVELQRTGRPR
jgi:hypothetical protein